jgi:hypothetical protein
MATGPLVIHHGSPNFWLSPDIWVTLSGQPNTPPGVANPIVGTTYDVQVRVENKSSSVVDDWTMFVCWAIPTLGGIPLTDISLAQQLNNNGITVPPGPNHIFQAANTWTPTFENHGHECLIAVVYWEGLPFPFPSLNGDAGPDQSWSIAQHNLGVVQAPIHPRRFHYTFQACNGADEERLFVVAARQAPLSEIAAFLPGVPGGRGLIDKPGKVERLGIVASAKPDPGELEAATAVLSPVKIAPRSCRLFTLSGGLEEGGALINVTQSLDERVVGGLSVLVIAETK